MRIKIKVAWGVTFLFALILTIGGVGIYYLKVLSHTSQLVLVDNYESLEYAKQIIRACEQLTQHSDQALQAIDQNITLQEQNVTEPGERQATRNLRITFETLRRNGIADSLVVRMRQLALVVQDVNMQAIVKKSAATQEKSGEAMNYLMIVGTVVALIAFTFVVNFPGYIANPVVQLTQSIKAIAKKNYEERLHFDRKDEFEELAEAFNQMAEKLDEYEHSNLAKILFEKKRIETIINRMSDPVMGLDEKSNVIFANDRALEILHITRPEIIDRYAPDVAVNNDLFRSLIKKSPDNKNEAPVIKAVFAGKENYFTREVTAITFSPTGEKDNLAIGSVILLKNVTSYKEQDLAKTNFMATISHELKTPIAAIQMCIKLLNDSRVGQLNDEQSSITRTLHDEITRLSKITGELLDLSQVETGNIKLDLRKTDPNDVITMAVEAVKFQADRKQVHVHIDPADKLPLLTIDADKTTWVLVNLLTNAIRYSPENGQIVVRCLPIRNRLIFSVEDQGPGIEPKYKARVFEKFFQVPGTPNGTGLGLAISREFIEAQRGEIHVDSQVGRGSIFSFTLPV